MEMSDSGWMEVLPGPCLGSYLTILTLVSLSREQQHCHLWSFEVVWGEHMAESVDWISS